MSRLIGIFAVFALFLTFIILNLNNKGSVNLGFIEFGDVPVYITVFISIFFGMIFSIPLLSASGKRKNHTRSIKPPKTGKPVRENPEDISGEKGPYGIN